MTDHLIRERIELQVTTHERDEARAEVGRLRRLRQHGCECTDEDACQFARERDEALLEVERMRECLRIAGLQAFMRGRAPKEVAKHLHEVSSSWALEVERLRARVVELRRTCDTLMAATNEQSKARNDD